MSQSGDVAGQTKKAKMAGTPAFAGVTREQVKAELAEAVRTGDIMAGGNSSLKLNELYPNRYPTR